MLRNGGADLALAPVADPAPYDRALAGVRVQRRTSGKARVSVDGGVLVVEGGPESLAVLAENVEGFAAEEGDPCHHLHIDYLPGHFYLAEGSAPLVVGWGAGASPDT
ncbi:hypothetical protein SUDANB121_00973 [Nocardiopsis dassonvillei]|uniref:Imm32 family immunity protein n=1 Tax=Nocardiopsis dassonvillei TaxID=2014 RepID=UPI003F546CB5